MNPRTPLYKKYTLNIPFLLVLKLLLGTYVKAIIYFLMKMFKKYLSDFYLN